MTATIELFREAMNRIIPPPDTIIPDGTLHRYDVPGDRPRSGNGWYTFYTDTPASGAFGCWKRGISEKWTEKEYKTFTPEEKARHKAHMDAARRQRDDAEQVKRSECRTLAVEVLKTATPAPGDHPYLVRKGVQAHGLEIDPEGRLLVPLRDTGGTLHGLQKIHTDGSKRFMSGTAVTGCYHAIGKPDGRLYIVEGYATGATVHEITGGAVAVAFNAGNLHAVAVALRQKYPDMELVLCSDDDRHHTEGNPGLTKATEAAQAVSGKLAIPKFSDPTSKGTDFNDLATEEGPEIVKQIIEQAILTPEPVQENPVQANLERPETLKETVKRLSELSPLEYEQVRKAEADKLKVRASVLDTTVKGARPKSQDAEDDAMFPTDEAWHEPVDGAQLIAELAATFARFSVLPPGSAITAAQWTVLTYCFDFWRTLPILAIDSPEKRCGKTTFVSTLTRLANRALPASNITPAALYRSIGIFRPTFLIDEGDAFLKDNEELRGIINSGHTKEAAFVIRCDGDDNTPTRFSTWCPKAIAMIGNLPDTIADRSISVSLRRKLAGETTEHHGDNGEDFTRLRSQILRWIDDHAAELRFAQPDRLDTQNDRQADNWRPLLAIAKVAGIESQARRAARLMIGEERVEPPIKEQLLSDIKAIFDADRTDRVSSSEMVRLLNEVDDGPWCEWKHGKPLTAPTLARLLKPFGIHPKKIRIGTVTVQGYELESFTDTFTRYTPTQTGTPEQTNDSSYLNRNIVETQSGTKWNRNTDAVDEMFQFQNVPVCEKEMFQFNTQESLTCSTVPLSQEGATVNILGKTYTEDDFYFEEEAA